MKYLAIVNVLWFIVNFLWFAQNIAKQEYWRRILKESDGLRDQAVKLFDAATHVKSVSALEHDYRVCSECGRIVVRHETDQAGKTTCVNCLADLARRT